MGKVYMVHWEEGKYSDFTYCVCGVFSSRERAVAYIEGQPIVARAVVYSRSYYRALRKNETREDTDIVIIPTSKDGETFQYISPLGTEAEYGYDPRTYYVTEYEMDVPNEKERDVCQST